MNILRPSLQVIAFFFLTFFAQAIKAECPTNIVLHAQSEIDSFRNIYPNCSMIWGSLTISGMDITSLDSLYGIKSVVGSLYIDSTSIVDLDGLDLNYFGGSTVHVKNNPNLISLEGLPGGSDCTNIIIKNNPSLINVEGITTIHHHGSMLIEHNGITSLVGLSQLPGSLKVKNNNHLKSFGDISSIEGILEIVDNDSLTCLCGLEELTILTRLSIEHNASLQSLQGLDSLQWMHANLEIRDNDQLIDIKALSHLEGINGTIIISENDILEDLNGLEAIKPPFFLDGFSYAINGIEITNNPSLTNCSIGIICTLVTFSSGSEIHDNAVGCNNSTEILDNCIVSTVTHLNQDEVRIIPNPSSDFIKIEGIESVDNVLIYNSLGRLVARSSDRVIAISNLPKGLYFIRIAQVDSIWMRKLIVE